MVSLKNKYIKLFAVGVMFCILVGCTSNNITIGVETSEKLNLSAGGKPLSVVLEIYQLSDIQAFNSASFEELWRNHEAILGDSLLDFKEKSVDPSSRLKIHLDQKENAKYVGVVAIFRDRKENSWRVSKELQDTVVDFVKFPVSLSIELSENELKIVK